MQILRLAQDDIVLYLNLSNAGLNGLLHPLRSLFGGEDCIGDFESLNYRRDIMDADDVCSFHDGCDDGRDGAIETLVGWSIVSVPGESAPDEGFARRPGEQG